MSEVKSIGECGVDCDKIIELEKQNEELIKVLIVTYQEMCESCHIVETCPFDCPEKVLIKELLEKHLQKPIEEIIGE